MLKFLLTQLKFCLVSSNDRNWLCTCLFQVMLHLGIILRRTMVEQKPVSITMWHIITYLHCPPLEADVALFLHCVIAADYYSVINANNNEQMEDKSALNYRYDTDFYESQLWLLHRHCNWLLFDADHFYAP